jgi:hypothetical protein
MLILQHAHCIGRAIRATQQQDNGVVGIWSSQRARWFSVGTVPDCTHRTLALAAIQSGYDSFRIDLISKF